MILYLVITWLMGLGLNSHLWEDEEYVGYTFCMVFSPIIIPIIAGFTLQRYFDKGL